MAFYHNFAGKIQKTGQDALDKTKKTAESMKVKSAISDLEKDIQSVYTEIGKAYYVKYAQDVQDEEMIPFFQKIQDDLAQIESYQEQLRVLKGMIKCKNCGKEIPDTAAVCSHCGAKLIPDAAVSAPVRKCPNCGQILEEGSLFCTECGTSVVDRAETESADESNVCKNCGAPLTSGQAFCSACGQKVSES
ncbi:MAG: zinc ribbon domain-containing protein [Clostridiales bacterium]|nr:zinc ribbon domain-containing protein [Clostridiales bacterium]